MPGPARRYGCPSPDNIRSACRLHGVYIVLTDPLTGQPTFVEVHEALLSVVVPGRLGRFVAQSFDGRTLFEGHVETRDGRFIAELTLTPLPARLPSA